MEATSCTFQEFSICGVSCQHPKNFWILEVLEFWTFGSSILNLQYITFWLIITLTVSFIFHFSVFPFHTKGRLYTNWQTYFTYSWYHSSAEDPEVGVVAVLLDAVRWKLSPVCLWLYWRKLGQCSRHNLAKISVWDRWIQCGCWGGKDLYKIKLVNQLFH